MPTARVQVVTPPTVNLLNHMYIDLLVGVVNYSMKFSVWMTSELSSTDVLTDPHEEQPNLPGPKQAGKILLVLLTTHLHTYIRWTGMNNIQHTHK